MNKEENEERIFNLVFSKNDFCKVIKIEQPDFKIINTQNDNSFGVEITELFQDETEARLAKIPDYVNEIIDVNKFRNKKDKKVFEVVSLTSIPDKPDEKSFTIQGLKRKIPYTFEKFLENLCNTITEKDKKYEKYDSSLAAIDLIIYNHDLSFIDDREELIYYLLYRNEFKQTILNSKFREIYFISSFNKGKLEYIQLKTRMFIHMFYCFNNITTEYFGSKIIRVLNHEFLKMFSVFLLKSGFNNIFMSSKGIPSIYYAHIKAVIDMNNSLFMKEYRYTIPIGVEKVTIKHQCSLNIDDDFMEFALKYQQKKVPKINLLFDTNE